MIYKLGERVPLLRGEHHFIAENATVIGSVILENQTSIWFNAVIRGDNDTITVGENSNIQDGAVLHTDPGVPLTIGKGVTIGHQAMLHGCTVGDNSLIGINAVVLNGATIGRNCIVGANALVTEGKTIPDNSLVVGSPAKVIRTLDEQSHDLLRLNAKVYTDNLHKFNGELESLDMSEISG